MKKLLKQWSDQDAEYVYILVDVREGDNFFQKTNIRNRGDIKWAMIIGDHYDIEVPSEPTKETVYL